MGALGELSISPHSTSTAYEYNLENETYALKHRQGLFNGFISRQSRLSHIPTLCQPPGLLTPIEYVVLYTMIDQNPIKLLWRYYTASRM